MKKRRIIICLYKKYVGTHTLIKRKKKLNKIENEQKKVNK